MLTHKFSSTGSRATSHNIQQHYTQANLIREERQREKKKRKKADEIIPQPGFKI